MVPFVAKVLESCAESRIFKPPNPWTMAIMSVLSELHSAPDLKLNLRFEVEVLCKHLNMEIAVSIHDSDITSVIHDFCFVKQKEFSTFSKGLYNVHALCDSTYC